MFSTLTQLDCFLSVDFVHIVCFFCPEAVIISAELLLDLEAGKEILVVRDASEAIRRGSLAVCKQHVRAAWQSLCQASCLADSRTGTAQQDWESRGVVGSTPANALPGPMVLLSKKG